MKFLISMLKDLGQKFPEGLQLSKAINDRPQVSFIWALLPHWVDLMLCGGRKRAECMLARWRMYQGPTPFLEA